jgi:hypothetical protein
MQKIRNVNGVMLVVRGATMEVVLKSQQKVAQIKIAMPVQMATTITQKLNLMNVPNVMYHVPHAMKEQTQTARFATTPATTWMW